MSGPALADQQDPPDEAAESGREATPDEKKKPAEATEDPAKGLPDDPTKAAPAQADPAQADPAAPADARPVENATPQVTAPPLPKEGDSPSEDPGAGDEDGPGPIDDFQDFKLEDLLDTVVSATKTEQRVEEAPAIVTVIRGSEIRDWGYDSVAELLQHVAGFYLIDDHITPNAAVRGISGGIRSDSGLIKVMIDGHPVTMRLTGGSWLGAELVPLSAVARVEIIRGPASALYGADAFLGVINVITHKGEDIQGMRTTLSAGATGANAGGGQDLTMGVRNGDLDLLLSARLQYQDLSGLRLPASSPAPTLWLGREDERRAADLEQISGVGLLKATYHLGEKSTLSAMGYLSFQDRGAEFADWMQLAHGQDAAGRDIDNRVSLVNSIVTVDLDLHLTDDLQLNLDGSYFRGQPTSRDRLEVGSDIYYIRRDFVYQGGELALGLRYAFLDSLSMVAGLDVMYDENDLPSILHVLKSAQSGLQAGDVREATSVRQGIEAFLNSGAYLQALWTPIEKLLSLTGGIRYDYHNIYGSQISGRAAAVVSPLDDLHIKLLYGNAFKAPSPLLLYGVPLRSGDIIGNPDLNPQRVHTFEFQLGYNPMAWLKLRTGLAYSYLLNKAEFTQRGLNKIAKNISEVGSLSWETEVEARYEEWLRAYMNFSYQFLVRDAGEPGYQAELVGSDINVYPPYMLNLGVMGRIPNTPVRLTVEGSWVSSRRSSDANSLENGAVYRLDSYFLLGASLALFDLQLYEQRKTTLRLDARNLLGEEGPMPGYGGIDYPLAPRTFMVRLTQEL